jgi:hypothetical protein
MGPCLGAVRHYENCVLEEINKFAHDVAVAEIDGVSLSEGTLFVSHHRGAGEIEHLHPTPSAPGAVRKIPALGHNPFRAQVCTTVDGVG